jgi:hypothetical protein
MTDSFQSLSVALDSPSGRLVAITKNDSTVLETTRGLYVGSGGNVVVTDNTGADVTFTGVAAGTLLPIRVTKVKSTNTTAADFMGLY